MKSVKGVYICTPPKGLGGFKTEEKKGFAFVKAAVDIVPLTLIIDSDDGLNAGQKIFVEEKSVTTEAWGKEVKRLNGQEVIIVPSARVVAID